MFTCVFDLFELTENQKKPRNSFNHEENRLACGSVASQLVSLIDDADDLVSRNASGACANLLSQPDESARLVAAAGAVAALTRALTRPQSVALAIRGLNNAAEQEDVALQCNVAIVPLVALCQDESVVEDASDALLHICRQADNARLLATDATSMKTLVKHLTVESVATLLAALCDMDGLRADITQALWGDLEAVLEAQAGQPAAEVAAKCLALLSVGAPARVLANAKLWLSLLAPTHSEALHVAGLMGLGNAACTEANVNQFAGTEGFVEAIAAVLHNAKATTNELHLALGVLGNLAVPVTHRARLVKLGVVDQCAALVQSNNNAHVLFVAAQLIRRLCVLDHEPIRPALDSLVAQHERLTQPEHQRIWLEICRIVCVNATPEYLGTHLECVQDLLQTDYAPLQLEACRAVAMTPGVVAKSEAHAGPIVEALFKLAQQGENRLQAAAALQSVLNRQEQSEHWKRLVDAVAQLTLDEKIGAAAKELAKTLE